MYCVKPKYFMIRNTLNYVWENPINLYGLLKDQTSLRFSTFGSFLVLDFSKLLCVLLKYPWIRDCDEPTLTNTAFLRKHFFFLLCRNHVTIRSRTGTKRAQASHVYSLISGGQALGGQTHPSKSPGFFKKNRFHKCNRFQDSLVEVSYFLVKSSNDVQLGRDSLDVFELVGPLKVQKKKKIACVLKSPPQGSFRWL